MQTASQMLYALVQPGPIEGCSDVAPFPCWVCSGTSSRGIPREKWMGSNFVGQNRVRAPASGTVCEACIWVMSGRPPNTERMYTNMVHGAVRLRVNKGDKPAMRDFLRQPHPHDWFAAIADSGQKHVVPWAPVNPGGSRGGAVLFEETLVTLPSTDDGWGLLDAITLLLTAGASKADIESGLYGQLAWSLCQDQIRAFEHAWGHERSGAFFTLAVWLAQRDEVVVAARMAAEKDARASKKSSTPKRSAKSKGKT